MRELHHLSSAHIHVRNLTRLFHLLHILNPLQVILKVLIEFAKFVIVEEPKILVCLLIFRMLSVPGPHDKNTHCGQRKKEVFLGGGAACRFASGTLSPPSVAEGEA